MYNLDMTQHKHPEIVQYILQYGWEKAKDKIQCSYLNDGKNRNWWSIRYDQELQAALLRGTGIADEADHEGQITESEVDFRLLDNQVKINGHDLYDTRVTIAPSQVDIDECTVYFVEKLIAPYFERVTIAEHGLVPVCEMFANGILHTNAPGATLFALARLTPIGE